MKRLTLTIAKEWNALGPKYLPFADAASEDLPLRRLLRLALFQVAVGMVIVLLNGTLNRVMVVELNIPVWLVSLMISLPLMFAPFRALVGHQSDNHKSFIGWRRVPYIWMGALLMFGGLAIMPFALLILSHQSSMPVGAGYASAALAFLLTGVGLHTTQTAGLALATDIAPQSSRPRVVALLYVMLLVGMVISSIIFSLLLKDFNSLKLIQVVQGAAVVSIILNMIALWQQEPRNQKLTEPNRARQSFSQAWKMFRQAGNSSRLLVVVALGTTAFSMQDILLEPYGGEILALSVSATTVLTAIFSTGTLIALGIASRSLSRGSDPSRLAAVGGLTGVFAFLAIMLAAPLEAVFLFYLGTTLIGFGSGLFAVGTLIYTMELSDIRQTGNQQLIQSGLALGAWGAVQATAGGVGIALGGALRDIFSQLAMQGSLGVVLITPVTGYGFVYLVEIILLFAAIAAIGPLVRKPTQINSSSSSSFGLAEFPG